MATPNIEDILTATQQAMTNPQVQFAMSNVNATYAAQAAQIKTAQVTGTIGAYTILLCAVLTTFFLWRIFLLMKNRSTKDHLPNVQIVFPNASRTPHVDAKQTTTKPPLPDSPSRNDLDNNRATKPTVPDDSLKHPHSRFMRPD